MSEPTKTFDLFHLYQDGHRQFIGDVIAENKLYHTFSLDFFQVEKLPEKLCNLAISASIHKLSSITKVAAYDSGLDTGLIMMTEKSRSVTIRGYFPTFEGTKSAIAELKSIMPVPPNRDNELNVQFWSWSSAGGGSSWISRKIETPAWNEIQSNYEKSVRDEINKLMLLKGDDVKGGKLVLWRGLPGTGKTYALRSLCRAWRQWCQSQYIIDLDVFFSNTEYMMDVITRNSEMADLDARIEMDGEDDVDEDFLAESTKWNLLILEDAGELITADAKVRTGQALTKLLNLTDGMLGQGLKLLILITTNEEEGALNPAINRDGRCLSNLVFKPFSISESQDWLRDRACLFNAKELANDNKRTLSHLYSILNNKKQISNRDEERKMGFV